MGVFFDEFATDLATILAIAIASLYYYLTWTFSYWERRKIPFVKPELFFGNMKDVVTFKMSQTEKFDEFYRGFKKGGHAYGGLFELRTPALLVCSPEVVKDVLVKNFSFLHDRGFAHDEGFDPFSAHLISLEGQKWKYVRSKLAPAFSGKKLKGMVRSFEEVAESVAGGWSAAADADDVLDMREAMSRAAIDVIGLCAFGLPFKSVEEKDSDFRRMGQKSLEISKTEKVLQIVRNVYPWLYRTFRLRIVPKDVSEFFTRLLRDAMEHRRKNGIEKDDILGYLMKIRTEKGLDLGEMEEMEGVVGYSTAVQQNAIELTEGVIGAQAYIFFLAGYETTSGTLSFCLYELAENPDVQERVHREIDETTKRHGGIGPEMVQDLKYLEQVIEETLRKHPPVPFLLRKTTACFALPGSEATLTPGSKIFVSIHSLHHDPEFFPNPERFDPERFSPENRDKIVPYSYLPFGGGPRICIGMRFAMMEMKTLLAKLLLKFTVSKCEKTKPPKIDPRAFTLTPIDGIWLKVVRRQTA